MERIARFVSLVWAFAALCAAVTCAADISVCTLNCRLLFDPDVEHAGKLDERNPLSREDYQGKVANLAGLLSGSDFAAVQEVGGKTELAAIAAAGRMNWRFAAGKDTYTGENVGFLHDARWRIISSGRVPSLDRILSKHLHVIVDIEGRRCT